MHVWHSKKRRTQDLWPEYLPSWPHVCSYVTFISLTIFFILLSSFFLLSNKPQTIFQARKSGIHEHTHPRRFIHSYARTLVTVFLSSKPKIRYLHPNLPGTKSCRHPSPFAAVKTSVVRFRVRQGKISEDSSIWKACTKPAKTDFDVRMHTKNLIICLHLDAMRFICLTDGKKRLKTVAERKAQVFFCFFELGRWCSLAYLCAYAERSVISLCESIVQRKAFQGSPWFTRLKKCKVLSCAKVIWEESKMWMGAALTVHALVLGRRHHGLLLRDHERKHSEHYGNQKFFADAGHAAVAAGQGSFGACVYYKHATGASVLRMSSPRLENIALSGLGRPECIIQIL